MGRSIRRRPVATLSAACTCGRSSIHLTRDLQYVRLSLGLRLASDMYISPALRDDLLAYLLCTSPDRARLIAELTARYPGIADLLMDLEADDDLRAQFEIELLSDKAG